MAEDFLTSRRRIIVVITEGAEPRLIARWRAAGLLPAFDALAAQGAGGPLDAEGTPYEPPGLVSLLTGQRAADHGCYSYWTCHDPQYQPKVLTSGDGRYPLLWQRPDLADTKVASIGLFGTHPPQPLNGWLITYPMYASLHACYPRDLQRQLAGRGIRPVHDVSIFWTGQKRDELLPQLLEADRQRGRAAMALFDDGADVVIVNLTSIDRTSHIYWHELEQLEDYGGAHGDGKNCAVLDAYRTADAVIADAMSRIDENTHVVAFSEIGFGPLRAYCSVNDILADRGFLKSGSESSVEFGGSKAFEAVQGTHGVNINVAGRYADGQVCASDYEKVRSDVAAALGEAINPRTGLPMFAAVSRREDVYPGSATDLAPDLILEPADWRYLPLGDPQWATHVNRTWQSGWHRRRSYWAGAGPRFLAGRRADQVAAVPDITATILDALARDPAESCAGTTLCDQARFPSQLRRSPPS
jgi:predicted AlkP superfamily phosphohydrolase/phosphomutase